VTYETTLNYSFPKVLTEVTFFLYPRKDTKDDEYYPKATYAKQAFSGPCRASVTETWSKTVPTGTATIDPPILSGRIQWATPYFSFDSGSCIHGPVNFTLTTGTVSDTYEYVIDKFNAAATNYVDWPASIIVSNEVAAQNEGYVTRQVTVYSPA
jgi:hypothetical protein